jgi:3-oxoacyl-(acyl-carrier-protein) synthase
VAPPSVNLVAPDYAPTAYDYAVAPATPLPPGRPAVLTNSFGFGGTYSALAFSVP